MSEHLDLAALRELHYRSLGNVYTVAPVATRALGILLDRLAAAEAFVAAVRADPYGCLDIIDALSAYDRLIAAGAQP